MTKRWFVPDRVFDCGALRTGIAVAITNGQVEAVDLASDLPQAAQVRRIAGTLTPGFVDVQVNGGGGVLLNRTPTPDGMLAIAAAHRKLGTVAIMPTVITDAPDVMQAAAAAAIVAHGQGGIAGLHIEGPHIAPVRRGTHAAAHLRAMDDTTIAVVRSLRRAGVPALITLAPEAATMAQITDLAATGAIVSLGHSDCDAATAQAALAAGARSFTHLYNAMSQMQGRTPNMTGTAINSDAYVGIICDGVHVADDMVALAVRARPVAGRMVLVSDAMPTVGGPDQFTLYDNTIRLDGGRLVNAEGNLAGAHTCQAWGVARLVQHCGLSLDVALHMAVTAPADLIGMPALARLQGRSADDVIVLDDHLQVTGPLSALI